MTNIFYSETENEIFLITATTTVLQQSIIVVEDERGGESIFTTRGEFQRFHRPLQLKKIGDLEEDIILVI